MVPPTRVRRLCSQGAVLRRIPGLDEESAAVLWTMVDRRDAESPHAAFWASLPQAAFGTALGVPGRVLRAALAGCPWLLEEALEARKVGTALCCSKACSRDGGVPRLTPCAARAAVKRLQHVRAQFRALQGVISALVKAYPQHVTPDAVSWRSYLWAVQLWCVPWGVKEQGVRPRGLHARAQAESGLWGAARGGLGTAPA